MPLYKRDKTKQNGIKDITNFYFSGHELEMSSLGGDEIVEEGEKQINF